MIERKWNYSAETDETLLKKRAYWRLIIADAPEGTAMHQIACWAVCGIRDEEIARFNHHR